MRHSLVIWIALSLAAGAICYDTPATAEIRQIQFSALSMASGTQLRFDTKQFYPSNSHYETLIDIDAFAADERAFSYGYRYDDDHFEARGHSTILNPSDCRALDPWWSGGSTTSSDRCELWLSTIAFAELKREGHTHFDLDVQVRGDRGLMLFVESSGHFSLQINGQNTEVKALELSSSQGDLLWVLDDPENPLVLSAKLPRIYSWQLTHIVSP